MISKIVIAAATVAAVGFAQPVYSATEQKQLGSVHFETSCNPAAQKLFDRAMLYQHSFWYSASRRTFEEVLKADSQCGMAYWGIALSLLYNPHAPPPPDNLPLGLEAVQKGRQWAQKRSASKIILMRLLRCTWITTRSIIARASRII